jgi:hypothetical protein
MSSIMTGGPGNASRVIEIRACPGATAFTSGAAGCAAQPAHQTAITSDPPIPSRMTGAAYACRAKPATAAVGGLVLSGRGCAVAASIAMPAVHLAGRVDDSGGGLIYRGAGVDFAKIIILSCIP